MLDAWRRPRSERAPRPGRHLCRGLGASAALLAAIGGVLGAADGPAREVPAGPRAVAAQCGSASHVDLSWEGGLPGAQALRIQRRDVTPKQASGWIDLATVPADHTRYQSVGLRARHTYVHRVRAESAAGAGPWAESGPVTTPDAPKDFRARPLLQDPGPFKRNGEGDLLELAGGDLVYVFGRWPERQDHSASPEIGLIRSPDGGRTWSKPETLFEEAGYDLYHASLARLKNGEIGLTYTKRRSPPVLTGEKVFRSSADEGRTWSAEVLVSDGNWQYYQTSACDRLLALASGRLVHPVSRMLDPKEPDRIVVTHVYISDNNGRTWVRRTAEPLAEPGANLFHEASVVEHAPGKLLLLARTRTGRFWESRSEDAGDTWFVPRPSPVGAPVAPPYLTSVPGSGAILLVWNPASSTELGPRDGLASQVSDDGGRTWRAYRQIEYVPGRAMSYASGLWVGDVLHLVYLEFGAWQPRYVALRKDWLLGGGGGPLP